MFFDEIFRQLGLGEFHFVHTFAGVPVQESLATEHAGVVLSDALEHFLDGGGIAEERDGHLQALRGDILNYSKKTKTTLNRVFETIWTKLNLRWHPGTAGTRRRGRSCFEIWMDKKCTANGGLDVAGDPLDEVGRVLILHVKHLFVNFLGRHASTEESGGGEVAAMTRVGGAHHVFGVEHLLGQPNTKSICWSKKNWNCKSKIKIWGFSTSLNANVGVSDRNSIGIKETDFQIFQIKFLAPQFTIVLWF